MPSTYLEQADEILRKQGAQPPNAFTIAQQQVAQGDTEAAARTLAAPVRIPGKLPVLQPQPDYLYKPASEVFKADGSIDKMAYIRMSNQLRGQYRQARRLGLDPSTLPQREDLKKPGIWWALDKLRTPQFITNALVYDMLDDKWDPTILMKSIAAAVTGDLRIEGRDIVGKIFGDTLPDGWTKSLVGFAWDVVADPLNFVSIVGLTKAGKFAEALKGAGGIVRAGEEYVDAAGILKKATEAMPYLVTMYDNAEVVQKLGDRIVGGSGKNLIFKLLSVDEELSPEAMQFMSKLKPRIGPDGSIIPGPLMAFLESKYGQAINAAAHNGRLEELISGHTLLERIQKGQQSFITLFGRSLIPKSWNEAIYQAGAMTFKTGADNIVKLPGMRMLVETAVAAGRKVKASFATNAAGVITDPVIKDTVDGLYHAEGDIRSYQSIRYQHVSTQFMKNLKRLGVSDQGQHDLIRAIEYPIVAQRRSFIMADPELRTVFANKIREIADTNMSFIYDRDKIQNWTETLLKPEVTTDELNGVMNGLHQFAQSSPENNIDWQLIWNNTFKDHTPYGGIMFGKWGNLEDIKAAAAQIIAPYSPEVRKVVDNFNGIMKAVALEEVSYGLPLKIVDGYFPRSQNPASHDLLNNLPFVIKRVNPKAQQFLKSREGTQWVMLDEANKIMASKVVTLEDVQDILEKTAGGGEQLAPFFTDDMPLAMAIRTSGKSPKAKAAAWVDQEMARRYGTHYNDEAWSFLEGLKPAREESLNYGYQTRKWTREERIAQAEAKRQGIEGARLQEYGMRQGESGQVVRGKSAIRAVAPTAAERLLQTQMSGLKDYINTEKYVKGEMAGEIANRVHDIEQHFGTEIASLRQEGADAGIWKLIQGVRKLKEPGIEDTLTHGTGIIGKVDKINARIGRMQGGFTPAQAEIFNRLGSISVARQEMKDMVVKLKGMQAGRAAEMSRVHGEQLQALLIQTAEESRLIQRMERLSIPTKAEAILKKKLAAVTNTDLKEMQLLGVNPRYLASLMGKRIKDMDRHIDTKMAAAGLRKAEGIGDITRQVLGGDVYYPDEIAAAIEGQNALRNSKTEQHMLVAIHAKLTGWWKGVTLGVNPGFHTRNMMTMLINNNLAGMKGANQLEGHTLAFVFQSKIQREWSKAGHWAANELEDPFWNRQFISSQGKVYTAREMADYLQRHVYGRGLFALEHPVALQTMLQDQAGGFNIQKINPFSSRNYMVRGGYAVGTAFENNGRSALWFHKVLNEGMSFEAAAKVVRKYHFDYDDLSKMERGVKQLIPFYTWSRNNIPLQFEHLFTNPVSATFWDKVRDMAQNGQELDYYQVSNAMTAGIPIQVQKDPKTGVASYVFMRNYVPLFDLNDLFSPMDMVITMLAPIPKLFLEIGQNYSAFFQEPIEKYPGQKRALWGIDLPAKWQYGLRTIGIIGQLDRLNPGNVFGGVHKAVYGTALQGAVGDTTIAKKYFGSATGLKIRTERPSDVLMSREYQHMDQMRRYLSTVKKQQKKERLKNANLEPPKP